jgi:hypothetical protein
MYVCIYTRILTHVRAGRGTHTSIHRYYHIHAQTYTCITNTHTQVRVANTSRGTLPGWHPDNEDKSDLMMSLCASRASSSVTQSVRRSDVSPSNSDSDSDSGSSNELVKFIHLLPLLGGQTQHMKKKHAPLHVVSPTRREEPESESYTGHILPGVDMGSTDLGTVHRRHGSLAAVHAHTRAAQEGAAAAADEGTPSGDPMDVFSGSYCR